MADTLDVLDLDEAKDAVGVSGTDYDDLLAPWITGTSFCLDQLVGPIVQRTLTDELYDGGWPDIDVTWWPVASVDELVEYDGTTETTLTAETNSTKPDDGYLLTPWHHDRTLYTGRIVRRSGNADTKFPAGRNNVKITYDAGRFATTAAVDERYKRAAAVILDNAFSRHQPDTFTVDGLDTNRRSILGFFVPQAVYMRLSGILAGEIRFQGGFA